MSELRLSSVIRAHNSTAEEDRIADAAPALLAAAEAVLAEFDNYDAAMTKIGRGHEDYGGKRAALRAAIALARGDGQ